MLCDLSGIRDRLPLLSILGMILLVLWSLFTLASAATFVVSNTNDSGAGSLRNQIIAANATTTADDIIFAIPGAGPHTIQPLSALPSITETLIIDGYTQAGASPATPSSPAVIKIEIDGSLAGDSSNGLDIVWSNCVIRGLCINRFGSRGIMIQGGDWNLIAGNYIGTDITGLLKRGNGDAGIFVYAVEYTGIGVDDPHERNIIGGNSEGIWLEGTTGWPNEYTLIRANYIGVGADGETDVGNASGIYVAHDTHETIIGGEDENHGNLIANNSGTGIVVFGSTAYDNTIIGNSIHSNGNLGIDLDWDGVSLNDPGDGDVGGNGRLNFPVLSSATRGWGTTTIKGTLNSYATTDYRLEFFYNTESDTTYHGEGEVWIGYKNVSTDGAGNAVFTALLPVPIPDSTFVTATSTDSYGSTSEFSKQVFVSTLQPEFDSGSLWIHWHNFPGAWEHWVFGEPNKPNFEADLNDLLNRIDVLSGDDTFWGSPEGIGDPNHNMTYQVIAVDESLQEIGRTNRAGEFDFGLQ